MVIFVTFPPPPHFFLDTQKPGYESPESLLQDWPQEAGVTGAAEGL